MSIDFSSVEVITNPTSTTDEPSIEIGDLEPVSWEIMNNNNEQDKNEKSENQMIETHSEPGKLLFFELFIYGVFEL